MASRKSHTSRTIETVFDLREDEQKPWVYQSYDGTIKVSTFVQQGSTRHTCELKMTETTAVKLLTELASTLEYNIEKRKPETADTE